MSTGGCFLLPVLQPLHQIRDGLGSLPETALLLKLKRLLNNYLLSPQEFGRLLLACPAQRVLCVTRSMPCPTLASIMPAHSTIQHIKSVCKALVGIAASRQQFAVFIFLTER